MIIYLHFRHKEAGAEWGQGSLPVVTQPVSDKPSTWPQASLAPEPDCPAVCRSMFNLVTTHGQTPTAGGNLITESGGAKSNIPREVSWNHVFLPQKLVGRQRLGAYSSQGRAWIWFQEAFVLPEACALYGIAQSRTWLKWLSRLSSIIFILSLKFYH